MKLLYFTFIENPFAPENAGVMRGQVINVLKSIATQNDDVEIHWLALINTVSYRPSEDEINELKAELKASNVTLKIIELPSGKLARWSFAKDQLSKYASIIYPDIVHCRVYPATLVALDTKKKYKFSYKVIFDARGVYPEQILERSTGIVGKVRYYWWKTIEKRLLKESDLIVGVTNAFIDHFKKIDDGATYKFIPCCVNIDEKDTRIVNNQLKSELGFKDSDIIAVYSGNLSSKYSSVNHIVEIFSNLYKKNSNFRFLVLTKSNSEELKSLLTNAGLVEKTVITSLKPQQVPEYLSICNIGTLFREKSIVNEVAMPTKFAEYISKGLPVIVSDTIKGVAELVKRENVGIVLSASEINDDDYQKLMSVNAGKCYDVSMQFSTNNVAKIYYQEYLCLMR